MKTSDPSRFLLAACIAAAMLAGCGGAQVQPAVNLPQTAGQASPSFPALRLGLHNPDALPECPAVGKTYTTGNASGRVSMFFNSTQVPLSAGRVYLGIKLVYSDWPESRPVLHYVLQPITCGPQAGKKPVGTAREFGGSFHQTCVNGICRIEISFELEYTLPQTLPGNKPWRFDYVRYRPEKSTRGYGALPAWRLRINP